jgi:preprotein translocase subunit SecG
MNTLLALILNIFSLILMTVCTVVFMQYSYRKKMTQYFSACQILIINWIVCHIIDIFSLNMTAKILFSNIGYISVCSIGAVFLLFSLYYIKSDIAQSKLFKIIIFIPSAVLYFIEITDPIFHLFFKKFFFGETLGGIGFYVTAVYNYILLIISICLMLIKNRKSFKKNTADDIDFFISCYTARN